MTKIESIYQDLITAQKRLEEVLQEPKTDIIRDATIKRFEFTFELSWKLISEILKENNINFYGMKSLFKDAGKLGIIDDVEEWFEYLEARNLTTHTYKETIADEVYETSKLFNANLPVLLGSIKEYIEKNA
jgi:nucleotidyltransferase substrate binding protein (TIGR01987 family)